MSQLDPPPPPAKTPHWGVISIGLLVIGLLILVPSGLCTMVLGGAMLFYEPSSFLAALAFGAMPIALGTVLVYAAFKLRRPD